MKLLRPLAAVTAPAVVVLALTAAGRGDVPLPPLREPDTWGLWLASTGPAAAVVGLVRRLALVAAWYLVVVTAAGLLLRVAGPAALLRLIDGFTLASLRRALDTAVTLSLVVPPAGIAGATTAVPAAGGPPTPAAGAPAHQPAFAPSPAALPVLQRLPAAPPEPEAGAAAPRAPSPASPAPGAERQRVAPPRRQFAPPSPLPQKSEAPAPARRAPRQPHHPASGSAPVQRAWAATWTVAPGDNFWSIAERVLRNARGATPPQRAVDRYWRALVAANRDRLRDPHDPDLLFAGQRLELPPPDPF